MTRLLLDERIRADGSHARCWASLVDTGGGHGEPRVHIVDDDGTDGVLSVHAIERVMLRYAREVDAGVIADTAAWGESLEVGAGRKLRRLRFRAQVDADGRDYLAWERPGEPPIAAIATMCTAALRYLVLRLDAESPQKTEGSGS